MGVGGRRSCSVAVGQRGGEEVWVKVSCVRFKAGRESGEAADGLKRELDLVREIGGSVRQRGAR
jgi:hypothetical protein